MAAPSQIRAAVRITAQLEFPTWTTCTRLGRTSPRRVHKTNPVRDRAPWLAIRLYSSAHPLPPPASKPSHQSSTSASASTSHQDERAAAHKVAYERLRPILDELPQEIDWAVAYGSGVIHQANASKGPPPMTDFLISTPSPAEFHKSNVKRNPSHYPLWARVGGGQAIASVQERWGAGLWYVTMVKIRGLEVKYGVISTSRLIRDMKDWETLYVAGRLHKPVLGLKSTPQIQSALEQNLRAALSLSLLILPERFTEYQLWEQITGISYSGDPRMSVPGAENPQKVKNIVRGPGNLDGFRDLYGAGLKEIDIMWDADVGLKVETQRKGEWSWKGDGNGVLVHPTTDDHYRSLIEALPADLQRKIHDHVSAASSSGELESSETIPEKALTEPLAQLGNAWKDIVQNQTFRDLLMRELRSIIYRPALTQSIKGLVTAGFVKSFQYSLAKFRKWLSSRSQRST